MLKKCKRLHPAGIKTSKLVTLKGLLICTRQMNVHLALHLHEMSGKMGPASIKRLAENERSPGSR
jgi:hypothetical protein